MPEEILSKNMLVMPAEWEKHSATWLAWPNDDDYFEDKLERIEKVYLEIIYNLHQDEIVKLVVLNEKMQNYVKSLFEKNNIDLIKIIFYQVEYMDVWMRDYGPTFVKNNEKICWVKWKYDCYGGKFPELAKDNNVFEKLTDILPYQKISAGFPMEGGAIDTNGKGVILTTKECLIENREIAKNIEEVKKLLNKTIGAEKVIWLNKGLVNDHTDGHIDEVARFVDESTIVCAFEDDVNDENYDRLKENFNILEKALDQNGDKFKIIKLPLPHMYYDYTEKGFGGKKAPVSYANFYITNNSVLMSIFGDKNDEKAISIIKACFPNKKIIPINCKDLIYGGGAIHCITQQEPAL